MFGVVWGRTRLKCSRSKSLFVAAIALLSALFAVISTSAVDANNLQNSEVDAPAVRRVVVTVNKSRTVRFRNPFTTAVVGSDAIADVRPMTDHTLYIQGKKIGTTNVSVFDQGMRLVEVVDLAVTVDTASLQRQIRSITGSYSIRVTASSNGHIVLSGTARDAVAADRAVSLAKSLVPAKAVINAMSVAPSQEVTLKVRFLEATRDAERSLGVNWSGTTSNGSKGVSIGTNTFALGAGSPTLAQGVSTLLSGSTPFGVVLANLVNGGTNIDVLVNALETKGVLRRLAEPNLVALSGDTAKFLAGGEFPVPILAGTGQGATPTVEFKRFGVSLAFTPTVLNSGLINLRIAPEVSEIDPAAGVTFQNTRIPGLVTRNAQTTVELRDGQSFAIAGLFQSRGNRDLSQLPWIGSVPVLGSLFRSTSFQNHETDLVIIVTPHLVRPGSPVDHLATPFDRRLPGNDVDMFVNGQLEIPKRYKDYVTSGGDLHGPYGYIIPVERGTNQPVYKGRVTK